MKRKFQFLPTVMKIFLVFFLIACNGINSKHIVTIKRGDTIIRGNIIGSVFNDTILYYNLADDLIRQSFFKDGKEEGMSIDFYPNGFRKNITNFSNGLKNGYHFSYDSSGKCHYRDFYYYDLPVGPVEYFNKDGSPKRYFFVSFENQTLLDIRYNEWNGAQDIVTQSIRCNSDFGKIDTTRAISVILYLMSPPKLSFDYSILIKKKDSEINVKDAQMIKSDLPFINFALPILPDDEKYVIGLNIYDSLLSKKTVIYKEL